MRITYFFLSLIICFCTTLQAQNRADELMKQAQSSLETKDYTKARYLFIQAYKAFANSGNYIQATECGTKAASLYYRENYYQEAFDLCRQMTQSLITEEQKAQKTFYDQRFLIAKERLQMYTKLKNATQAQLQLNELSNLVAQSGNHELSDDLLYTQTNYYYTFGQDEQGDAAFQKLINQYREKKEFDKVSECYKNLIAIAHKANNAPLMERTYEKYIVWTDSVKALTAQDKLSVLQREYDDSQQTIQEKDDKLSSKQYLIVALCTFVAILIAVLIFGVFLLLRFIVLNKKLKNIIQTTNEHSEQQTRFIQNLSEQMRPTLDKLELSAGELRAVAPKPAESIQVRVDALKQFGLNIQELSSLESSLLESYEAQSFSVGNFCKKTMEKIEGQVQPDVEIIVDAPQLDIKTNAEHLERLLLHLLSNAAKYTSSGKIKLEFKRKGAHLCQFVITDNGTGIPADKKTDLFKPFTEARDLADGDGLGLPICALIANKINGTLSIDMEYNKGCRFILALQV